MKISLLLPDLFDSIGGIQTFNRCFVKALDEIVLKEKVKISILALKDSGENKNFKKYIKSSNTSYLGFKNNKFLFSLKTLKEAKDSDLIIFGHVNFSPLATLMKNKKKKLLIVHGTDVWGKLPVIQSLGISRIQEVLSVSSFTKEKMCASNHTDNKFTIFPNTLDPFLVSDHKIIPRETLPLPNGNILLTVSRLGTGDKTKRIDITIESMPDILKNYPDTYLVVTGDGPDRKRLENISKENGVLNNVLFLGRVNDDLLPSYYNACDIFVLPSVQEGFGIVFLEAMYYSKPCIGSKAGGIPEVIEDGITGLLAEANDKESLTKHILELLRNKELRQKMGEAGKKRFEENFSFEAFRGRLEKIVTNI